MGTASGKGERIAAESYASAACMPIRLVLDNVRSGQNVGACFRSGDAFRIEGLDLCGITCHPPHRDILKSALGSSGHVPWQPWENTLDAVNSLQARRLEGGCSGASRRQHVASRVAARFE